MRVCNACQAWLKDWEGVWINKKLYCDYRCYHISRREYDSLSVGKHIIKQAMPDDDNFL